METKNNKGKTFIGFAVRKGATAINVNAIARVKKAYLIVVCSSAGENTKNKSLSLSNKFGCPILTMTCGTLADLLKKEKAKAIAILDANLAKAILDNSFDGFREGI